VLCLLAGLIPGFTDSDLFAQVPIPVDTAIVAPLPVDSLHPIEPDSTAGVPEDSLGLAIPDSLRSRAERPSAHFVPPHRGDSPERRRFERQLAGASPLLPAADQLAAGDLADWLGLLGAYDVDDAPGVGQNRFFTHWGLQSREGRWSVDGRRFAWQRLTFPMVARFDPGVLPSFPFAVYTIGEQVQLDYDTLWAGPARSSYFFRQGDYGDSYSEGTFRRLFGPRFGLDLSFTFFNSTGRYLSDNRDTRFLNVQAAGPITQRLHWRYRFVQFRDKTIILTPEPFTVMTPRRDDLLWRIDWELYSPADSSHDGWRTGVQIHSGKQKLRDDIEGYRLKSRDRRLTFWGRRTFRDFLLDGEIVLEELLIGDVAPDRWGLLLRVGRQLALGEMWDALVRINYSDWDTDPPAAGGVVLLTPDDDQPTLFPSLRLERRRDVATLFDRYRPAADSMFSLNATPGEVFYSEGGDAQLPAQWENAVSLRWSNGVRRETGWRYAIAGRIAYIEDYIYWKDTSGVATHVAMHPVAEDVRSTGASIDLAIPVLRSLTLYTGYAVKYVVDLADVKLPEYYPHKANAILSWYRPRWHWDIDARINLIGVWWYADRRIDPTQFTEPHVFRFDISGMARMGEFSFNYLIQNVFDFAYRTRAGFPETGRTVRFGIEWLFRD
jgi:hypothetical protein